MLSMWMIGLIAAGGAPAPHLVIDRPAGTTISATVDFDQVAACFDPPARLEPDALVAGVPNGEGGYTPLSATFDPDQPGGQTGELTVYLGEAAPAGPVHVFFTAAAPIRPPAAGPGALQVSRDGGVITVAGPYYRVVHDPAKNGGLPSLIELRPSGKVFDSLVFHDRVWTRLTGGFELGDDPEPSVEVLVADGQRVVVRVRARYLAGGTAPPTRPRASYEFTYLPGSPEVIVSGRFEQDAAWPWSEHHFLQLHFDDQAWPGWLGPDGAVTPFAAEKASAVVPWAAFADGDSVVGLLGLGSVRVYDGRGEYGTYLHGPWEQWTTTTQRYEKILYLSGAPGSREAIAAAAGAGRRVVRALALPATTHERLAMLADGAAQRPTMGWLASLIRGLAAEGRLLDAHRTAGELMLRSQGEAENLTWLQPRVGAYLLASDELGVAVRGGMLTSLYDLGAQRELLGAAVPLWQATLRTDDRRLLDYRPDGAAAAQPAELTRATMLQHSHQGSLRDGQRSVPGPRVTTTLQLGGPRLRLHIDIDNDTPYSLWNVRTPELALPPLGGDGRDDAVLYPFRCGVLRENPTVTGVQYGSRYPSGAAVMQFSAMYDAAGGVYLGIHDPEASCKEPRVQGPDADNRIAMWYEWPMPDMGKPGNDWRQPGETVIELFRGDWYDASLIYRDWVAAEAPWWPARSERRTPEWMPELCVWALPNGHAYEPDNVVARVKRFAEFMDVPTAIHWYTWHEIPFDTYYPHYNPTKPRMAEGVAELQAAGVRVMPYINGRLWDSRLDDFKEAAIASACWTEEGRPYIEEYGNGVPNAPMDPTTELWQRTVRETVLWLQDEVGVDGVYIDQIGAAAPVLQFNPNVAHPLGGGSWWTVDGYWPLLARLRAEMGDDKFITTEDNADCYAHLMDGFLAWAWQSDGMVPAFSAVYAGQIAMFGRAGNGDDLARRMKAAQSLVFGEQLGWWDPGVVEQPAGVLLRECARMRHELIEFLAHGTMLRPPVLGDMPEVTADWAFGGPSQVTFGVVQTGAWRAPDGRVAIILANCGDEEVTTTVEFDRADYGYRPDATLTAFTRQPGVDGGRLALPPDWTGPVTVPAMGAMAIVIEAP